MRALLAYRDARLYLVGQVFSLFGDSCLWLAMGIWVKTLTHSNAAAGLTFFGAAFPWVVVAFITLLQRLTPAELQGRAYSTATTMAITPQTISIAVGAALIAVTGYRPLLAVMAAVMTLAAAYLLIRTRQQHPATAATPAPPHLPPVRPAGPSAGDENAPQPGVVHGGP
jgi:hypothetical protein